MSKPILIALSRLNSYFQCPRLFWWNYEYKGSGLRGTKSPIPLAVGGAIHKGLESLLRGMEIEPSIQQAVGEFRDRLQKSPLILEPTEDVLFAYTEQEKLIEALVRVFALRGLPKLKSEYEILEIEQEYDFKLSDNVILRSKADGLLRSKGNGQLYVLSFKTAKYYSSRHSSDGSHDVQGLSEAAAIEPIIGEEINGIQMLYLVKGDRKQTRPGSGHFIQNTLLLHPWFNKGTERFAWSYKWTDSNGAGHTLGKDYQRVNIWEHMPLSDWLGRLDRLEIQPEAGDALESVLIQPPPYYRRHSELEDWVDQTRTIGEKLFEARVARQVNEQRGEMEPGQLRKFLNETFPQNRRACDWPSACSMQNICFGPCGSEPEETGFYQIRREWIYESEEE